ncbi:MAG: hypothetical protein LBC42_03540 [Puniceicoccales bacterium]|jgi:DNA polymerase III delta subunit|nr:hypothetical protein [Puniceicoccales bacterium]
MVLLAAINLVYGDDEFSVSRCAEQLAAEALSRNSQWQVECFDGRLSCVEDFQKFNDEFENALATRPLFAPEKIFHIKFCTFLSKIPLACGETLQRTLQLIGRAQELSLTVIVAASPIDRRLNSFKVLSKIAQRSCEVTNCSSSAAENVFAEDVVRLSLRFSREVRDYFLGKVGDDARHVASELEKLKVFLGTGKMVRREDVQHLTVEGVSENFFEPIEAFYHCDAAAYATALERFFEGRGEPRALLAAFMNRNRLLLQIKAIQMSGHSRILDPDDDSDSHRGEKDPCSILDQNPYYLKRLRRIVDRFLLEELTNLQVKFIELFTDIVRNFRFVTPQWLRGKFLSLL